MAVLGCSGSIGTQTLDVCRQHADKLDVVAISVFNSTEFAAKAAREFGVSHVAVANAAHRDDAALEGLPKGCSLGFGEDAVTALAQLPEVDCVVNALVGAAAMPPSRRARSWRTPTRSPSWWAVTYSCPW